MKDAQTTLKKKLHSDTICNHIATAMIFIASLFSLASFFLKLDSMRVLIDQGKDYTSINPGESLHDFIFYLFLSVILLLLSLILSEIHKTGKPFSKRIIGLLRAMAFILIFAGIIPQLISSMVMDFLDPTAVSSFTVGSLNIGVWILGTVIGLISEIFKYGYDLQDNMDSIA